MHDTLNITKALADPSRLRVLMALRHGELCVCEIQHLLSLAMATVSRHMSILAQAGLVDSRKAGRWVYYRLPDQPSKAAIDALTFVHQSLNDSREIKTDEATLSELQSSKPETPCNPSKN